jgi:hypothetical protein
VKEIKYQTYNTNFFHNRTSYERDIGVLRSLNVVKIVSRLENRAPLVIVVTKEIMPHETSPNYNSGAI